MDEAVEPFGPRYQERTRNGARGDECAVCGRHTGDDANTLQVRVVDGGERFAHPDEEADADGDMGYFPVGGGCARLLPPGYAVRP